MFFLRTAAIRTTDWLIAGGGITEEDREVYEYGFDKFYSIIVNILFAISFGLFSGMFFQTITFYASYMALRVYAGGIHADTQWRCFFASILILIPSLFAIHFQYLWNTPLLFYGMLILSAIILCLLAPVGSKNKMPDELEKVVYRRRMIRNLAVLIIAAAALSIFSINDYASAVLVGVLLSVVMVVAGKIKIINSP